MQISTLIPQIIEVIERNGGIVEGTEFLALELNAPNKPWVVQCVRRLARDGEIQIIIGGGGRGHKTIYKRNRNSPGAPIRRRKR